MDKQKAPRDKATTQRHQNYLLALLSAVSVKARAEENVCNEGFLPFVELPVKLH